jgi:3,4-dihydroxy 2-butanone 4-phosphate synthase/GTP cyclohydrolase II
VAGRGVLVYLRDGTSGVPTTAIAEATGAEDCTASERERNREWREVGLGAQILRDLRISSIRLYATRERSYVGLAGFGIEIESTETLEEASDPRLTLRKPRDGSAADC